MPDKPITPEEPHEQPADDKPPSMEERVAELERVVYGQGAKE